LRNYYTWTEKKKEGNKQSITFKNYGTRKETKSKNHGVQEGNEIQIKVVQKLFNETIAENYPKPGKDMDIQVQEEFRTSHRLKQIISSLCHILFKVLRL
jgi:hypothetical protein